MVSPRGLLEGTRRGFPRAAFEGHLIHPPTQSVSYTGVVRVYLIGAESRGELTWDSTSTIKQRWVPPTAGPAPRWSRYEVVLVSRGTLLIVRTWIRHERGRWGRTATSAIAVIHLYWIFVMELGPLLLELSL